MPAKKKPEPKIAHVKRTRSSSPTVVPKKLTKAEPENKPKVTGNVDPDLPMTPEGKIYHLGCHASDVADKFIFVGDPDRVEYVAEWLDPGSITFKGRHREIVIMTGTFKGVPVSILSTGMGTDNIEIVMNEVYALKEFSVKTGKWDETRGKKGKVHIIRVGTCGSPRPDLRVGTLAISKHAIGMDNTCQYYDATKADKYPPSVAELKKIVNATQLGRVGVYTSMASPEVTGALEKAVNKFNKLRKADAQRPYIIGTTASGSGFYGCQGRGVGLFKDKLVVPNLVDVLGAVELPVAKGKVEKVVNIEMENSAICYLSHMLGYKAGTVCVVIATRAGNVREFATPELMHKALGDAITIALNALISIE